MQTANPYTLYVFHISCFSGAAVEKILRETGALEPLLRDGHIESGLHATGTHWHTPKMTAP